MTNTQTNIADLTDNALVEAFHTLEAHLENAPATGSFSADVDRLNALFAEIKTRRL